MSVSKIVVTLIFAAYCLVLIVVSKRVHDPNDKLVCKGFAWLSGLVAALFALQGSQWVWKAVVIGVVLLAVVLFRLYKLAREHDEDIQAALQEDANTNVHSIYD